MSNTLAKKAAEIVRDAGGRIVGRTKFQKIAYLLTATGLESGLPFVYKHYGPYSEPFSAALREANLLGLLKETEDLASWGGTYSIYTVSDQPDPSAHPARLKLARVAVNADAVELELAATAVFLSKEGHQNPWSETERRKPEKAANGRLAKAKALYQQLREITTPIGLPNII